MSKLNPIDDQVGIELAVSVRLLEPDDLESGFLESLEALTEVGLTAATARDVYKTLPANLLTFVAVREDRVVGTASLLIERKFIHGGGRVGHIEDVAVSKAYQGRGIGTKLVRHAVLRAGREGCYKVILDCFDPLLHFYERMGFRPFNRGLRLDLPPPTVIES